LLDQKKQNVAVSINQGDIQLNNVAWLEEDGQEAHLFSGCRVVLRITLHIVRPHENLSLGFMIRNRLGQDLFGVNTAQIGAELPTNTLGLLQVDYPITLNFGAGEYLLFIALHDKEDYTKNVQIWEQASMSFTVHNANQIGVGQVYCPVLKPSWSFVE
jgi:lipopolysaccharide transport system ATP-binding protein